MSYETSIMNNIPHASETQTTKASAARRVQLAVRQGGTRSLGIVIMSATAGGNRAAPSHANTRENVSMNDAIGMMTGSETVTTGTAGGARGGTKIMITTMNEIEGMLLERHQNHTGAVNASATTDQVARSHARTVTMKRIITTNATLLQVARSCISTATMNTMHLQMVQRRTRMITSARARTWRAAQRTLMRTHPIAMGETHHARKKKGTGDGKRINTGMMNQGGGTGGTVQRPTGGEAVAKTETETGTEIEIERSEPAGGTMRIDGTISTMITIEDIAVIDTVAGPNTQTLGLTTTEMTGRKRRFWMIIIMDPVAGGRVEAAVAIVPEDGVRRGPQTEEMGARIANTIARGASVKSTVPGTTTLLLMRAPHP
ncbi:hypothetical protein BD779DRAFT_331856 [Infundibulicybe gibba]|nr:hypothetical protein BD779DRAFT_331856 [Infundibulicybe gibba]